MVQIFNIFTLLSLFLFMILPGCRSGVYSFSTVNETIFDGIIVQENYNGLDISKCMVFIRENEADTYLMLKKYVKKIQLSPYFYDRSFPYYDIINISQFSLERGIVHASSVLIHELYHIIFQKIRNNSNDINRELFDFLNIKGIHITDVLSMSRSVEEELIYNVQLKFLIKLGSKRDIEYQIMRMEKLGISVDKRG